MPHITVAPDPVAGRDARSDRFDHCRAGLVCKICHATVPNMGSHPEEHLEWHQRLDGRTSESGQ
jgi:hypothetical protein